MCNHLAQLILRLDKNHIFLLAPLNGETFQKVVPTAIRDELPDSLVVLTDTGDVLVRSDSVIFIGKRLGGLPRICAFLLALTPRLIRDGMYRGIAAIRYRIFGTISQQCSIIPPTYRQRLLP